MTALSFMLSPILVLSLSGISIPFQNSIDLPAEKDNVHTHIQPQQDKDQCCHASIHTGESSKDIQIDREEKRDQQPSACCEHGSRELSAHSRLRSMPSVRQKFVHKIPEDRQDDKRDKSPDPHDKVHYLAEEWDILIYHHADTVPEDRDDQREHNRQKEQDCIY